MSVQFGKWNIDGQPVDPGYLQKAKGMLAPYGPDGEGAYIKDNVGILYGAFHTTMESRRESQPLITPSGTVICWDGRLDNRSELITGLKGFLPADPTDVEIVAAAYELQGTECFAQLRGDWALAIWTPSTRSLLLAKDFIGTRHLYYSVDKCQITWSTTLDPLVLLPGKSFALVEEYIAGWLSFFPATHLTPYAGIHAVPPSCFVRLEPRQQTIHKYWDFDPSKRIRYRTDSEYEEHFRQVFGESVKRRLRSDSPVLAELSGGMDSSSIVCMADTIIGQGAAETPRLDTVSCYDDSEPNWNERPYFTKVEEKRGCSGCHIDVSKQNPFKLQKKVNRFPAAPSCGSCLDDPAKRFGACMSAGGNHVVLSGTGGDEITGGPPNPTPELEDLLANARFGDLAKQLKAWALSKRKPWFYLLFDAMRGFFPASLISVPKSKNPAPWINADFAKRNQMALQGYQHRLRLFGPLPSFQENVCTLDALRRQLACSAIPFEPPYEKRYPYLDRDLVEFTYAIPREQRVRPGQRRSLIRRALVGIVPQEILDRKRKAYVARAPLAAISMEWLSLTEMTHHMFSGSQRIIVPEAYQKGLQRAREGTDPMVVPLMRTLELEFWLRQLLHWRPQTEVSISESRQSRATKEIQLARVELFTNPRRKICLTRNHKSSNWMP